MGIKDIGFPFNPSESDLVLALADYFRELGFEHHEMQLETSFEIRLGHTAIKVGGGADTSRASGRSDLLLTRNSQPIALVEAKRPGLELTNEDRDQGLSYSRLLRSMPPYTIVTNGTDFLVYDTFTTELIQSDTPESSLWWGNHQSFEGLGPVDREWAARTLFSLNYAIAQKYCQIQSERNLAAVKGDKKRYRPELYSSRASVDLALRAFQDSDEIIFAIVGDSGYGKTNELCALVDTYLSARKPLTLFYRAVNLSVGLLDAIRSDFEWEFEREEPVSRIVQRFAELARTHNTQFAIVVDGLDEYPGSLEVFRAELVQFTDRLVEDTIQLYVSCKSYDWQRIAYDRDGNFNPLGERTLKTRDGNSGDFPGVRLSRFSDAELDHIWGNYQAVFDIRRELAGQTREVCRVPLMLRLVAEAHTGMEQAIPPNFTNVEILEQYWQRQTANFTRQQRLAAETIVSRAAERMVETDRRELDETSFFRSVDQSYFSGDVYDELLRVGLVVLEEYEDVSLVAFPFDTLLAYVYSKHARHWPSILNNKQVESSEIKAALQSRVGRDCLLFYLAAYDSGWLQFLVERDFVLFAELMVPVAGGMENQNRFALSDVERNIPHQLKNRVKRFIFSYSTLREKFPALKDRLSPYSETEAGLWIYEEMGGLRGLTQEHPERFLLLNEQVFGEIWSGSLSAQTQKDYCLAGGATDLLDRLAKQLPEVLAFSILTEQIAKLVGRQLLDETTCPAILSDRVARFLNDSVMGYVTMPGRPVYTYWRFLGYASYQELANATCTEVLSRVRSKREYLKARAQEAEDTQKVHFFTLREWLRALEWYLNQLQKQGNSAPIRPFEEREWILLLTDETQEKEEVLNIVEKKALSVWRNCRLLIGTNFPELVAALRTAQLTNCYLLLEISRSGDYTYVWFPSVTPFSVSTRIVDKSTNPPSKMIVTESEGKREFRIEGHSDSALSYYVRSKSDTWRSNRVQDIAFLGEVIIDTILDDRKIHEPSAMISRVRSLGRTYTDQVYELLTNEIAGVLGPDFGRILRQVPGNRYMLPDRISGLPSEKAKSLSNSYLGRGNRVTIGGVQAYPEITLEKLFFPESQSASESRGST